MARLRRFNPAQARDRHGRWTRAAGSLTGGSGNRRVVNAVPYARVSPRSVTGGVNAGTKLGSKHRLVIGGYARIERTTTTKGEKQLKQALDNATPLAKFGLKKIMSKQAKIGKNASAHLGTSSSGLPSVIIRRGMSKVPGDKRAKGIQQFNAAMERNAAGKKVKKTRPQRRKSLPGAAG
jgi:hypothetical protein